MPLNKSDIQKRKPTSSKMEPVIDLRIAAMAKTRELYDHGNAVDYTIRETLKLSVAFWSCLKIQIFPLLNTSRRYILPYTALGVRDVSKHSTGEKDPKEIKLLISSHRRIQQRIENHVEVPPSHLLNDDPEAVHNYRSIIKCSM